MLIFLLLLTKGYIIKFITLILIFSTILFSKTIHKNFGYSVEYTTDYSIPYLVKFYNDIPLDYIKYAKFLEYKE